MSTNSDEVQSTVKLARSAISEVTPSTLQRCSSQFLSISFQNKTVIEQIAKLVLDLVLEKPASSSLYAELCWKRIINDCVGDMACVYLFRDALVNHAQTVFAETVSACKKKAQSGPNMGPDSDKMGQCGAICCFMSYLFNHRIVQLCDMKRYLDDLLIPEPYNEKLFGCAIQMIRVAGKKLTATGDGKVYVTKTLERLEAASQNFSHESRTMLSDLEKLRQKGWVDDDELLKTEPSCSGCARFSREIELLKTQNEQLQSQNEQLQSHNQQLLARCEAMTSEMAQIKARLSKLEQPQQNVAE